MMFDEIITKYNLNGDICVSQNLQASNTDLYSDVGCSRPAWRHHRRQHQQTQHQHQQQQQLTPHWCAAAPSDWSVATNGTVSIHDVLCHTVIKYCPIIFALTAARGGEGGTASYRGGVWERDMPLPINFFFIWKGGFWCILSGTFCPCHCQKNVEFSPEVVIWWTLKMYFWATVNTLLE